MLRWVFAVLLVATPAKADDTALIARYGDIRMECRQGESVDGRELSQEESDASCKALEPIGKELTDKGYCWDSGEQTWIICPLTN